VALTHWHWDHSFGLTAMKATSIAHKNTAKKLIELGRLDWDDEAVNKRVQEGTENTFVQDMIKEEYPAPDRKIQVEIPEITLTEKITIDLGNIHCLIEHVGGDHSPDSTVIVIPEEKVAFIGDSLYPNPYGKVAGKGEYSRQKLLPLIDRLLSYDVELYVDSHDNPAPKKEFQKRCQLLQDIGSLVGDYETQSSEALRALKKKAAIQGVMIDNSWLEDAEWIIQAFQAGLD
jgi:glyoxylase-like metal-dependent hydrolase (beta-lactamase superfamily II)